MAIARRMGYGKKIILGDKNEKNAQAIAELMNRAGFDVEPFVMDMSVRTSIQAMVQIATEYGEVKALICGAGVSPSQAPIDVILQVDL